MEERGLRPGHIVAFLGAIASVGSLWAPWYSVAFARIAQAVLGQSSTFFSPAANQLLQSRLSAIPANASISIDAWQAFHQTDIIIAALGGLGTLAVLAAGGAFGAAVNVDRAAAARLCTAFGLAVVGVVIHRYLDSPGPDTLVTVQWGLWAALGGGAAMVIGGAWASRTASSATVVPTVDLWADPVAPVRTGVNPGASVAPPGF